MNVKSNRPNNCSQICDRNFSLLLSLEIYIRSNQVSCWCPYPVSRPILLARSYRWIYVSKLCNMSPVTASWMTTVLLTMWLLGLWYNKVGESEERQPIDNIFYDQNQPNNIWRKKKKQGPTRHRPMAHPVVFRYLSYSTTLAEYAFHRIHRGARPSAGLGHVCSRLFS